MTKTFCDFCGEPSQREYTVRHQAKDRVSRDVVVVCTRQDICLDCLILALPAYRAEQAKAATEE